MVNLQGTRVSGSGKTAVNLYFKNDNGIVLGLRSLDKRVPINLYNYMTRRSKEVENYMKQNHPWQNRTGRAEAGLHTKVENLSGGIGSRVAIGLYHGDIVWPWYGIHLEYSMGRRFAIIEPTQKFYGPKIINELNMSELYRFVSNPKN